jgi:hypothetical protein
MSVRYEYLPPDAEARCCPLCDDGDGNCAFPYYGAAPHQCFHTIGLQVGQSSELPEAKWPANFKLDPDEGPFTGYPRAGTYTHCLNCGAPNCPHEQPDSVAAGLRGFGVVITLGGARNWYAGADGVRRWSNNDQPCDHPPPRGCHEPPNV